MQTLQSRQAGARRRGVTLVEAVLFISVSLGLIVGGIVFFQQAMTARKTQEFIRLSNSLVAEVRTIYRTGSRLPTLPFAPSQLNFLASTLGQALTTAYLGVANGYSDPIFVASGSVPGQYHRATPRTTGLAGSMLITPWGTEMGMAVVNVFGRDLIAIVIDGVPAAACVRIAPIDAGGRSLVSDRMFLVYVASSFDNGSSLAPTTLTPALAASADYCMVNNGEPVHMRLLIQI